MKCSHCRILIMTFLINVARNSQNLTQKLLVIDPFNILESNCGICSHLTWKVLITCMYLKEIYANGVSRNMRIRFLRRWIYSNNLSAWLDWLSTYFYFLSLLLLPYFYYNNILFIPSTFFSCLWMVSNALIIVPNELYHLIIYLYMCVHMSVCN